MEEGLYNCLIYDFLKKRLPIPKIKLRKIWKFPKQFRVCVTENLRVILHVKTSLELREGDKNMFEYSIRDKPKLRYKYFQSSTNFSF